MKRKRTKAILLMAGNGSRFQSEIPKQFQLLAQKKIYLHTLEILIAASVFDSIILVCHPDWIDEVQDETHHFDASLQIISGGTTRQESSYLGLLAAATCDFILIHDAVRPFITKEIIERNLGGVQKWGAVDTCIPSSDTLVRQKQTEPLIESIPDRSLYLRGQTPQTFIYQNILQAHKQALLEGIQNASDDCQLLLRIQKPIHPVLGSETNIKITTQWDLYLAECISKSSIVSSSCF